MPNSENNKNESTPKVVVIGGAITDFKAYTHARAILGTSNPGDTSHTAGGVARNIAENLARLSIHTELITAIGRDTVGADIMRPTEEAGVDTTGVLRIEHASTGTYAAIMDATGELLVAVVSMHIIDAITPEVIKKRRKQLQSANWIVVDGNLSPATIREILIIASKAKVPVVYEPVSTPKSTNVLPAIEEGFPPHCITPNINELEALVGHEIEKNTNSIRSAALELHAQGVGVVWVSLGADGSLLSTQDKLESFAALPVDALDVLDVTGAGDSMLATFLAALISGRDMNHAAKLAHAAAAITISNVLTVVPGITLERLEDIVKSESLRITN